MHTIKNALQDCPIGEPVTVQTRTSAEEIAVYIAENKDLNSGAKL